MSRCPPRSPPGHKASSSSTSRAGPAGKYGTQREYKPVGSDPEPEIGGRVIAPEQTNLRDFTIELLNRNARPAWSSGRIGLNANGSFMASLFAQKGVTNVFMIELRDGGGVQHETVPDRLTYTIGVPFDRAPLIHSLGVALADNKAEWIIEKGTALPAKKFEPLRSTLHRRQGDATQSIRIPIIEGQHARADRNKVIGAICIDGTTIRRALPSGTDAEAM